MNPDFFYESVLIRRILLFLFLIWTLITCYLTLVPGSMLGHVSLFQYDKFGHAGMFFGWTLFLGLSRLHKRDLTNTFLLITLITGMAFGGLIEILQWIMPFQRDPDIKDFIADSVGCWSAFILLTFLRERVQAFATHHTLMSKN